MDTRNRRMGPWDSLTFLTDSITALEDTYVKAIWFESISSGTSGTFSAPTGGTIVLNEWAAGVDALVSGIDSGVPTFEPVLDTEGVQVSATLDTSGNWTLSGVPVNGYPVSIIYAYTVKFTDFDFSKTLNPAMVEGPITVKYLGDVTDDITGFTDQGRTEVTFSVADTTGVVTVEPTGDQFSVWVKGREFIFTEATTTTLDKTEGVHIVYFDSTGTLQSGTSGIDDLIESNGFVCYVYWDASSNVALALGDERHGVSMSGKTHHYLHDTVGAKYGSGLAIADVDADASGDDNTSAYFSISDGVIFDEDLEISTSTSSQTLTLPAQIPVWYMEGATGTWRKDTADDYPVKNFVGGSSLLAYNLDTAGTWSQAEVTNNAFVLCHIFCTNDTNDPVIAVQGQSEYLTIVAARAAVETEIANLRTDGLPVLEFVPLYTLIYQTSTGYSNDVKGRIRTDGDGNSYIDWRGNILVGSGGAPTDHEALSGLLGGASNDHYHLTSAQHTDLTDGGESTLHYHDSLKDGDQIGAVYATGGECQLNYGGVVAMKTAATGIDVYDTDGSQPQVILYSSSASYLAVIKANSDDLEIKNRVNGGSMEFTCDTSGGVDTRLMYLDPDVSSKIYHKGSLSLATRADGIGVYDNSGDDPSISMFDSSLNEMFNFGAAGTSDLYIRNFKEPGDIWLGAENADGTIYWVGLNPTVPDFAPSPDSAVNLGKSSVCWLNVYADAGVTSCSDEKYKKDIQVTQLGLAFLNDLVPVAFKFRKDGKRPKNHDRVYQGFLANEVEAVLQDHGHTYQDFGGLEESFDEDNDRWLGLKYEQFVAPIIMGIQELTTRMEDVEALANTLYTQSQYLTEQNNLKDQRIADLEAQAADFEKRIGDIEKTASPEKK